MIKKDIFKQLNKEQYAAAVTDLGSILVLAGAGTGKTSTIVGRVIHLLTIKKYKPKDIILFTFTNKAATEMKERLKLYIDDSLVDEMSVSTFHSMCLAVIKKYYPDKKLVDGRELLSLLETAYSKVIKIKPEGFYAPSTLLSYIENYNNSNVDDYFSDYMQSKLVGNQSNEDVDTFLFDQYQLVYDVFTESKEKYNVVSFTDLLIVARDYMLENSNTIKEIIVDEFQDTNPLQISLLDSIAPDSIFCVGDYDQSIYAFNGADLAIIEKFQKRDRFILHNLSKNYRCRAPILEVAEKVIRNNPRIYPKKLEVMVKAEGALYPVCRPYNEHLEQYDEVSDLCEQILSSKKNDETVAVLYRSNNSGNAIEMFFREKEIPFSRNVKNTFMDNIEIQIIFNLIKLIVYRNLDYLEFVTLFSGIVVPTSKEAIESYYNMITGYGRGYVYDGLKRDRAKQIVNRGVFYDNAQDTAKDLVAILDFDKHIRPESFIKRLLKSNFFVNTLNNIASEAGDEDKANKVFDGFMSRAESIERLTSRYAKLDKFYTDMMRPILQDENEESVDKVHLLTSHASKGLEFDYVFVIDLDDVTFPNKRLMLNANDDSEERRLFYVACTRAKKELCFTYSKFNKKKKPLIPSRFLVEAGLAEMPKKK